MSAGQDTPSFDLLRMDRQIQARETRRRGAKVAVFTGLMAVGVARRGWFGWIGVGLGALGLFKELVEWSQSLPEWKKLAASRKNQPGALKRLLQPGRRAGAVDQAAAYSFPASDSPSHHDIH